MTRVRVCSLQGMVSGFTDTPRAMVFSIGVHLALVVYLLFQPPRSSIGFVWAPSQESAPMGALLADAPATMPPSGEPAVDLSPPQAEPETRTDLTPITSTAVESAFQIDTVANVPRSGIGTALPGPIPGFRGKIGVTGAGKKSGGNGGAASYTPPRYLQAPAPDYPLEAKRLRREGVVMLTVMVNENGLPTSIQLHHSSGMKSLDEAAIRAVRRWIFQPAQMAGRALSAIVEIPVRFRLTS